MKRKRDRPRDNDKEEKPRPKKAIVAAWALGVGLSLGLLAFIGGLAIDLQMAIKLGVIGIVLGAVGGAIAAAVDRVPTNRYRSVWRRQPRSYLSNIYRYHSGVTYRKDLDNDEGAIDDENE